MGGLHKHMKITSVTFFIGCLAIAGIPGFSGFFSKDEILAGAFAHSPVVYSLALFAALMTAYYMFRSKADVCRVRACAHLHVCIVDYSAALAAAAWQHVESTARL